MNQDDERNGWKEWSKHILNGLERLDKQIETLRQDLARANMDIVKMGYMQSTLNEMENKINLLKSEINSQNDLFRQAVKSLELDDAEGERKLNIQLDILNKEMSAFREFATKARTIGWIIASIISALVGMLSFSISEIFKH